MKTNSEYMAIIKPHIVELSAKAGAGDKDAVVEHAWAVAIYKFLEKGYLLTDLPWFKGTSVYTGDHQHKLDKVA